MVRDTAKKLDAADTYIWIERTYGKSVENMGSEWNEFTDVAVKNLYEEMSEEYLKQLQERERRKERKERMDFLREAIEIKKCWTINKMAEEKKDTNDLLGEESGE